MKYLYGDIKIKWILCRWDSKWKGFEFRIGLNCLKKLNKFICFEMGWVKERVGWKKFF